MKRLVLSAIQFYRRCISPHFPPCCRFRPGTGTYTYADGRIQSGRWKDGKFLG